MSFFLGIDTSNYTTSAALFDGERVLRNEKKLLPVKPGEKGLRQSDAVFHHVRQLPQVLGPLLEEPGHPPAAVGVSVFPCEEEGSYMPCFLVGKGTGELLGYPERDCPKICVNALSGAEQKQHTGGFQSYGFCKWGQQTVIP